VVVVVLTTGCCLGWLLAVATGYPRVDKGVRWTIGQMLQWTAILCGVSAGAIVLVELHTRCGTELGPAASAAKWLLLIGVATFTAGLLTLRPRAGWVAGAAVVVVDLALAMLNLAAPLSAARTAAVMVFLVHAGCTAVATWWARQLRSSPPPLPAKAAEASRILCASWIIAGLLLIADNPGEHLLSDNTLVTLFIATGVSLVLGSGYTRYAEARADPAACSAEPDAVTELVSWLGKRSRQGTRWTRRLADWAVRYSRDFEACLAEPGLPAIENAHKAYHDLLARHGAYAADHLDPA
jgi:hypothetical protein